MQYLSKLVPSAPHLSTPNTAKFVLVRKFRSLMYIYIYQWVEISLTRPVIAYRTCLVLYTGPTNFAARRDTLFLLPVANGPASFAQPFSYSRRNTGGYR